MKLFAGLFQRRLRGFKIIDLTAFACLTALVLAVYAFKAHAGGESAKIAEVDTQIADEQRRIRLLDADLAHLEQPERLERLSTQYLGLSPIVAKHETLPASLTEIARQGGSGGMSADGELGSESAAAPADQTPHKPALATPAPASAPQ